MSAAATAAGAMRRAPQHDEAPVYCHYCDAPTYHRSSPEALGQADRIRTRDHKAPQALRSAKERTDEPSNIVPACAQCNSLKGSAPYEVYVAWLRFKGKRSGRADHRGFIRFVHDLTLRGLAALQADGGGP